MIGNDKGLSGEIGSDPSKQCSNGHHSSRYSYKIWYAPIQILGVEDWRFHQVGSLVGRKEDCIGNLGSLK